MVKLNTLEEIASSFKVYQQLCTGWGWLKSEAVKRNLTATMKKLEDTMTKQNQDFKQTQNEKEEIQKEIQKVKVGAGGGGNKNLMDFEKRIAEKVLKCAGAGSKSEDPIVNTQKGKIKFLLGNADCSLTV